MRMFRPPAMITRRSTIGPLLGLALAMAAPSIASAQTYDVIIRNGRVIDGTGNPWFLADVALDGDRIAAMGDLRAARAERDIDATGLYVTPGFIDAHSGSPWFVSMVGFVAGLPFMYQMVDRSKQIQVPKYLSPRTDTPKLTIGYGGCFSCIYSVRGAGGYQMFGVTPMPIYDPNQEVSYLKDFMVFFNPGDIVKFKPIDRATYDRIVADVNAGLYEPKIRPVTFSLDDFQKDIDGTNQKLLDVLQ